MAVMREMREICIVSSAKDYAEMEYFKEFFKWIGCSFFVSVYQDRPENADLNKVLENTGAKFDMILYIGDDSRDWLRRYSQCGKLHIHVLQKSIWEEYTYRRQPTEIKKLRLREDLLADVWESICEKLSSMPQVTQKIMSKLIKVYAKYDLLHALIDNRYSLYIRQGETKLSKIESGKRKSWEKAAAELEKFSEKYRNGPAAEGMEYLTYALCYCRRKVNEYCNLCREERTYPTWKLLDQIDEIYRYDDGFYAAENLKAKVSLLDEEKRSFTISYFRNCTLACEVGLSNSYHYYRLGKRYELSHMEEKAAKAFRISYDKNPLNFRAQFKLAADSYRKKKWEKAKQDLSGVLKTLQLNAGDEQSFLERLNLLPPLELEYASKCCILLGKIEEKDDSHRAELYYKKVETIRNCVGTNTYLKTMFPEKKVYEPVRAGVEARLTKKTIEEKVKSLAI